ncbi:hypothetical protein CRG98_007697 [Punica granatum]|uniref:Uncharacterized protein n=1 Tax=Punica granatum TaxID=22663 RepID=A0A2I0KTZ2_PUNGR|nr:hypothetical protein CRG98_007697 [Punica granatum]
MTAAVESTDSGEDLVEASNLRGLLVFLCDFTAKTVSLGPEVIELGLDSRIRGGECSGWSASFGLWIVSGVFVCWRTPLIKGKDVFLGGLEILFLEGWMLGELRTLDDHGSPRVQNSFGVTLAISGCLVLPPSVLEPRSCRILGDCLQATKLPHHSRREVCGGPYMAHE